MPREDLVQADDMTIEEIERLAKVGTEIVVADGHVFIKEEK